MAHVCRQLVLVVLVCLSLFLSAPALHTWPLPSPPVDAASSLPGHSLPCSCLTPPLSSDWCGDRYCSYPLHRLVRRLTGWQLSTACLITEAIKTLRFIQSARPSVCDCSPMLCVSVLCAPLTISVVPCGRACSFR